MAVDSLYDDALAVHIKNIALYFNLFEAYADALCGNKPSSRSQAEHELIKIGLFRRPCAHIFFNMAEIENGFAAPCLNLFGNNFFLLSAADERSLKGAGSICAVIIESCFKIEHTV